MGYEKLGIARPLRLQFGGAVYPLTSRGNARQKIFFNDADRELFLSTLAHVVSRYRWICHAYCLMANHYHLLVETPKPNLSIGMRPKRDIPRVSIAAINA
jgi:putative transposase